MLSFLTIFVFALGIISLLLAIFKANKYPSQNLGSIIIFLYLSLASLVIVFSLNLVKTNTISVEVESMKTRTNKLEKERDSLKAKLEYTKADLFSSDNKLMKSNNTTLPLKIRLQQLLNKINLEIIPQLKNDNATCVFINQTNLNSLLEMKDSLAIQSILKIEPTGNTLISNTKHSSNCINDVTDGFLTGYLLIKLKNFPD